MNWHVFYGFLAFVTFLGLMASLVYTMTAFDFDGPRVGIPLAVLTISIATLCAFFVAMAVPA